MKEVSNLQKPLNVFILTLKTKQKIVQSNKCSLII